MNFDDVTEQIYDRLKLLPDLRTIHQDPGTIVPPVAILSYPDKIDPHGTYNRGMSRMGMQLLIVVGKPKERTTPQRLAVWARDSGPTSVLAWLEAEDWVHSAFDMLTVTLMWIDPVDIADIPYMAVFFDLDVVGKGS